MKFYIIMNLINIIIFSFFTITIKKLIRFLEKDD